MKWKPELNDRYYIPNFELEIMYKPSIWLNDKYDRLRLELNLVCKTKKEAIRKANIMLKALKNETK